MIDLIHPHDGFRGLSAVAEERGLSALQGDAPLGYVEILFVELEADIMPV